MTSPINETLELLAKWRSIKAPIHVEVADLGFRASFDGVVTGINAGSLELRSPGCQMVLFLGGCSFEYESEIALSAGEKDYMTSVLKVVNPPSSTRSVVIYELAR